MNFECLLETHFKILLFFSVWHHPMQEFLDSTVPFALQALWEAADSGQSTWVPAKHMGDLSEF